MRDRVFYQALSVFASQVSATGAQTAAGTIKQLTRVQTFDDSFSRSFQDINQYGMLAAIDRIELDAPTVNGSVSYYVTDGSNEKYLGLTVPNNGSEVSCVSGILNKATDEKNLYLLIVSDGNDAINYTGPSSGVMAIGNSFLTSYSTEGSVGSIPTATANFEGLNMRIYGNATGINPVPAVTPSNGLPVQGVNFRLPVAVENDSITQPTALRPGDITLDIAGTFGVIAADLNVQSYTFSFDLARTPLTKLGSRFPTTRVVNFPATATMSFEARLGDLQDANLADLICQTGVNNLSVTLKENDCSGNGLPALKYTLKGAKLDSQNFTTSIGADATVSFQFSSQISGPQDLTRGVFISGSQA